MSRSVTALPMKLALLCLLAWCGVGAAGAASASAQAIFFCVPVTAGSGGFNDNACTMAAGTRTWAIAYPGPSAKMNVCLKVPAPMGSFNTSNCATAGGTKEWELFNTLAPVPAIQGTSSSSIISGIDAGVKFEVKCTSDTYSAQPEPGGAYSGGKFELKTCTVVKPANCTVNEPIKAEFTGQLEESEGKVVDKLVGSKGSEGFAEITFKGESCGFKGTTLTLKGTETCGYDTEVGTLKFEHEMICKTTGSKLKAAGQTATYEGTDTKVIAKNEEGEFTWAELG